MLTTQYCKNRSLQTQEIVRLNGVYQRILGNSGVTMIEGAGSLVDAHTVEVTKPDGSKQRYTAKHILIATGSRAQRVNIPGKVTKFSASLCKLVSYVWQVVNSIVTCLTTSLYSPTFVPETFGLTS